ncbi:acyl-CoA thioesterase [Frigidibacter sp. SD6-1]|uniref:acyl-CoA thioesterase n=1 Tax=Frigidibacter sp. SD6-1 TaxID=3032581 RepID=UPI0024DF8E7F|nr:acyl-CoA thioesterase [Frigidibacter sp. SD6-1]
MYPFVRMAKEIWISRRQPAIGLLDTHVSHHICWPWDLDFFLELNNGRTLTLFDLGRVPLGMRTGFNAALSRRRWGVAVAGSAIRYRRRVRAFDRVTIRTRCIGWDARFLYMEQSMWKGEDCTSQQVIRSAVTSKAGIVPVADVLAEMGVRRESPALPAWVAAWIEAEGLRPWPPET